MTRNRALQAIAMGTLFAAVSAFMPSATETIKSLWDISLDHNSSVELKTTDLTSLVLYILTIGLTFFLGYFWENASQKELNDKHIALDRKLSDQTTNSHFIMEYLHTMPPQKYLAQFEMTYLAMRAFLSDIQRLSNGKYSSKKELISSVNECEGIVCKMNELLIRITKQWDTQGTVFDSGIEYRVNVMIYCDAEESLKQFSEGPYEWKHSERFFMAFKPEGILTDVNGVLFVDERLDIHYSEEQGIHTLAQKRSPIALPVTLHDTDCRYPEQNLPGAPKAYATQQAQYISCCNTEIHDEIDAIEHISDFLKQELKSYYCKETFAQSIISFPLHRAGDKVFGVLNVYRNRNHLAKRNENDFMALMKPLTVTISEAVYELCLMRSDAQDESMFRDLEVEKC
ncbi:hypothetical protein L9W86_17190 [Vibrio aestuarianus]|nr:hypothetical protein [Vibrio aestuarianus]